MEYTRMSFADEPKLEQEHVTVCSGWQISNKHNRMQAIGRLVDEESEEQALRCKSKENGDEVDSILKKDTNRHKCYCLDSLVLDKITERLDSIDKRISEMDNESKSPIANRLTGEPKYKYKWANIIRSGGKPGTKKKVISPQTPLLRAKEVEKQKLKKISKSRTSPKQGNRPSPYLMKNSAIGMKKRTPNRLESSRQCKTRRCLGLVGADDEVCSNLVPVPINSSSSSLKILGAYLHFCLENTTSKQMTKRDDKNVDMEILYGKSKKEIDQCSLPIRMKNSLLDYLLDVKLPPSTLLMSVLGQDANRKEFRCLAPCEWLQCEVLNYYAAILTINIRKNNPREHNSIWYMPTWFQV